MEEQRAVVVEMGSIYTRVGMAGEDRPLNTFHTVIAYGDGEEDSMNVEKEEALESSLEEEDKGRDRKQAIGGEALTDGTLYDVRWPIQQGEMLSVIDVEQIWGHIYANELNVVSEDHGVMVCDAVLHSHRSRELLAQLLFENFDVPSLYVSAQPLMALYSCGFTSGVVVDIGSSQSTITPVLEGSLLQHAVQSVPVGGEEMTAHLRSLLLQRRRSGCTLNDYSFLDTPCSSYHVRMLKENLGFVALDYETALATPNYSLAASAAVRRHGARVGDSTAFKLSTGNTVSLDQERYMLSEVLFQPAMIGKRSLGVHLAVEAAISSCEADVRSELASNLVLCGGGARLAGLKDRMMEELHRVLPLVNYGVNVTVTVPDHCDEAAWFGGSIVGSLPNFMQTGLTREEYSEFGPSAIHKRCFA